MNIVNSGNNFVVYGEDIRTYKELPANTYRVCFDINKGFSLELHDDLGVKEKVYGQYPRKVVKVMNTFKNFNRNLGVILSGPKGSGKSVFARLLAEEGRENGIPLIIVDRSYDGIDTFIGSIKQECIVLFDEFEKVFDCRTNAQDRLLPLFDGIDSGKKLYVITCNTVELVNQFFFNRPGRFHYHFTFGAPSKDEVREYLDDNLVGDARKYSKELEMLSSFSSFTYDILRAIAYELNSGYALDETLEDLNIQYSSNIHINSVAEFSNGLKARISGGPCILNLNRYDCRYIFDFEKSTIPKIMKDICDKNGDIIDDVDIVISFKISSIKFSEGSLSIDPSDIDYHLRCASRELEDYFGELILTNFLLAKVDSNVGGMKISGIKVRNCEDETNY